MNKSLLSKFKKEKKESANGIYRFEVKADKLQLFHINLIEK